MMILRIILLFCHLQRDSFCSVGFSPHDVNTEAAEIRHHNRTQIEVRIWPALFTLIFLSGEKSTFSKRHTTNVPLELIAFKWWALYAKEIQRVGIWCYSLEKQKGKGVWKSFCCGQPVSSTESLPPRLQVISHPYFSTSSAPLLCELMTSSIFFRGHSSPLSSVVSLSDFLVTCGQLGSRNMQMKHSRNNS